MLAAAVRPSLVVKHRVFRSPLVSPVAIRLEALQASERAEMTVPL